MTWTGTPPWQPTAVLPTLTGQNWGTGTGPLTVTDVAELIMRVIEDNTTGQITALDVRNSFDLVLSLIAAEQGGAKDWDATVVYKPGALVWDGNQLFHASALHDPAAGPEVAPSDKASTGWDLVSSKGGATFVTRVGDLPDPTTTQLQDGQIFIVRQDLAGNPVTQIAVWDANKSNIPPGGAVGATPAPGGWVFPVPNIFSKALRSDADTASGQRENDLQITLEPTHTEIKIWANGAWQNLFSDDEINRRIASLSLFEGTAKEVGGTAIGAIDFATLPDLAAMTTAKDLSKVSHYWTFIGSPNTQVTATTPEIGADLTGAVLNPGDWLQIANRGTVAAPDLHWVTVGGDLLAKARAERLFGLQPWSSGGWEQGSLVMFGDGIYRATQPVTASDPDPGVAGTAANPNPWTKISVSGGTKVAPDDISLPLSAPAEEIWLVLDSSRAGSAPGLFTYDAAAGEWKQLGGRGGAPIDMSTADELISVGLPIGAVTAYAAATPPHGWIVCDGRDIPAEYKQLIALIGPKVPDLRDQFIRGGTPEAGFAKHRWTTGGPRTPFGTDTHGEHQHGSAGQHRHRLEYVKDDESGSGYVASGRGDNIDGSGTTISASGDHQHPAAGNHEHTITRGGDTETAPDHVILSYIIKAADRTAIRRIL